MRFVVFFVPTRQCLFFPSLPIVIFDLYLAIHPSGNLAWKQEKERRRKSKEISVTEVNEIGDARKR